jgi:hypothetical protein
MDSACSGRGRIKQCERVLVEKPEGKSHQEDLKIGGRILKRILRQIEWGDMDWINLA